MIAEQETILPDEAVAEHLQLLVDLPNGRQKTQLDDGECRRSADIVFGPLAAGDAHRSLPFRWRPQLSHIVQLDGESHVLHCFKDT